VGIYNRSQIHVCRNWERGRAVSFLEICVSNFRCSVFHGRHPERRLNCTQADTTQKKSPSALTNCVSLILILFS
jgi:hypothetical protein